MGQGQLDDVLQAGPEARRALIEEAAGVLKHRRRKEKALRKLEAMQANLTRLVDLTGELRRRLEPLGRQAALARRAAVIQADLRDARLRLLADDYVTAAADLERGREATRPPRWPGAESWSRPWRRRASASPRSTPPSRNTRHGWRRRRRHGSPSPRSPSACAAVGRVAQERHSHLAADAGAAAPRPRPGRARAGSGRRSATRKHCSGSGSRPPGSN